MTKSSRPQWLQSAANYLLDNVFDILTIAAAAYIVIRHQFRPYGPNDIAELATWILAVLGFIAVSGLWQQHRRLDVIEDLSQETHDLVARRLGGQLRAEDFFWPSDKKVTSHDLAKASDIYVVGTTLSRTVRDHMADFSKRLASGANLRFILLDWTNETLMTVVPHRGYGLRAKDWWQSRIGQTKELIDDIPNLDDSKGTLKVGYLPYMPSFGMWLIDPDKPYGQIHVEIYHHRSAEENPTFSLHAGQDSYWYSFFRRQFDLLWKSCEEHGKVVDIMPSAIQPS